MKNKIFILVPLIVLCLITLMGVSECEYKYTPTASQKAMIEQAQMAEQAAVSVPIPKVSYFQEKRTIAKWAERWDKPNLPCFVYLISYGTIIGYYVTDGKPASTRSYIMPEESYQKMTYGDIPTTSTLSYSWQLTQAPDIDGTYGDNNPGIRFFTAEGTAVEWAGNGASYIYSDAPLPLNVPKLNKAK